MGVVRGALIALAAAGLARPAAAQGVVTVDFAVDAGPTTYRAAGFLHGITPTTPDDQIVRPLKPSLFRCAAWTECYSIYDRAAAMGAAVQFVLSDGYRYRAPWPGDSSDFSGWLDVVRTSVTRAREQGQTFQWDIWNEPNGREFWGRDAAQFYETWRQAYVAIREIDPSATIVGPSLSAFSSRYLQAFLLFAKANGVLPDVLSWHDNSIDHQALPGQVQAMRAWMAANGIDIRRISINEYDGNLPIAFASLERAGVESAAHTCWKCPQELDGVTANPALYAAYRGYAELSGRLVAVLPGAGVDGTAAVDSGLATARLVLGKTTPLGDATLRLTHLPGYLVEDGRVRVVARRVDWSAKPVTVIDARIDVSGDSAEVTLPQFGTRDRTFNTYLVTLTGPRRPAPATLSALEAGGER
jgi:hypothetical protein